MKSLLTQGLNEIFILWGIGMKSNKYCGNHYYFINGYFHQRKVMFGQTGFDIDRYTYPLAQRCNHPRIKKPSWNETFKDYYEK